MKPLKQSISITLDSDVIAAIKVRAQDCDRSVSQYINLVLKEHLQGSLTCAVYPPTITKHRLAKNPPNGVAF